MSRLLGDPLRRGISAGTEADAPPASRSPAPTAAEQLVDFCLGLSWEQLPEPVRTRTRELVLDHCGVALAALDADSSRALGEALKPIGSRGSVTVIGWEGGWQPEWACLANGTLAHTLELDDCTRESSLHPGVAVIPAALAAAEESDANAATFFEGVIAGYEVMMRVGAALGPGSAYRRGFHPTGVAGTFGAAIAAGRVLRLSATQLTSALGIAGTMASGSLEYLTDGAWTKRLNPGWAAHAGITAARLARAEYVGPATVFEGPLGFLGAYSDSPDPGLLTAELGDPLRIMRVAIKPYACCRYSHGIIDAVLQLRQQGQIPTADVEAIELGVLSIARSLVADPIDHKRAPTSIVDAQFSAPFAAAVALTHGSAGIAQFTPRALTDPVIRRLMQVSTCFTDPTLDAAFPSAMPAVVRLTLADGTVSEGRVEFPLGEPENPLTSAAVLDRFVELAAPALGNVEARLFGVDLLELPAAEPVGRLVSRLRTHHQSPKDSSLSAAPAEG